jgi:hypothetical protein
MDIVYKITGRPALRLLHLLVETQEVMTRNVEDAGAFAMLRSHLSLQND